MLGLKFPTDPRWADLAQISLEDILTDHAYCEQKAATACIGLISVFPERTEMVDALAPIVTEEWGHFRLVLAELKKRGYTLGRQRKDDYVNKLLSFQKAGGRDTVLVERLLTFALIEARSCERFRLLSLHLQDPALRAFYHTFMVAEAGHYRLFIDLARTYGDLEYVQKRWNEYLEFEAQMIISLEVRGDRVH